MTGLPSTPEGLEEQLKEYIWKAIKEWQQNGGDFYQVILSGIHTFMDNNLPPNHVLWVEDCDYPGEYKWEVVARTLTAEDKAQRKGPFTLQLTPYVVEVE